MQQTSSSGQPSPSPETVDVNDSVQGGTIDSLIKKRPVKLHQDNKNGFPRMYVAIIGVVIFLFVNSANAQKAKNDAINATKTTYAQPSTPLVRIFVTPDLTKIAANLNVTPTLAPTGTPTASPRPTLTLTPSSTWTPSATVTWTPTPTQTPFVGVVWVSLRSVWPNNSGKTITGVDFHTCEGYCAACPYEWPLGTRIILKEAELICVDRGRLACRDNVCSVAIFTRDGIRQLANAQLVFPTYLPATAAR